MRREVAELSTWAEIRETLTHIPHHTYTYRPRPRYVGVVGVDPAAPTPQREWERRDGGEYRSAWLPVVPNYHLKHEPQRAW